MRNSEVETLKRSISILLSVAIGIFATGAAWAKDRDAQDYPATNTGKNVRDRA